MVMRGGKKKRSETVVSRKDLIHGFYPRIFQDRGTKRARSQRQVSCDPEIRNGCKKKKKKTGRIQRGTIERGRITSPFFFCE